jgi:hypothetical protein
MVPFTIFQRLSSLGSGGGVKAGTIPPIADSGLRIEWGRRSAPRLVLFYKSKSFANRDHGHRGGKESQLVARLHVVSKMFEDSIRDKLPRLTEIAVLRVTSHRRSPIS